MPGWPAYYFALLVASSTVPPDDVQAAASGVMPRAQLWNGLYSGMTMDQIADYFTSNQVEYRTRVVKGVTVPYPDQRLDIFGYHAHPYFMYRNRLLAGISINIERSHPFYDDMMPRLTKKYGRPLTTTSGNSIFNPVMRVKQYYISAVFAGEGTHIEVSYTGKCSGSYAAYITIAPAQRKIAASAGVDSVSEDRFCR